MRWFEPKSLRLVVIVIVLLVGIDLVQVVSDPKCYQNLAPMKMVLAERNNDSVRNGKRSRGPSPNGHGSPDSSSDDENAEKIRVGRDYQAVCPELEPVEQRKPEQIADRALLVWSPTIDISDNKLDEYITVAKEKYGYNGEQALGMLFWHKHDLNRAALDLANFTPFPDEWTVEDKVLFEQAFQFHGKSFHRIRQMLPDKSIASLVKYYYSWKKTRARTSLMDRGSGVGPGPIGNKHDRSSDGGGSEHGGSDKESDGEEKVQQNKQHLSSLKRKVADAGGASGMEELRPGEPPAKINSRWTNDELLMAVTGVRKYGKDFAAIAETIGTKTEQHLRTFFASYRRRYNLDAVLREYEAERGGSMQGDGTADSDVNIGVAGIAVGSNEAGPEQSNGTGTNGASNTTPAIIKDDKMEVDSEGCPLGAPAEQGGAPTTPTKPKAYSK